MGVLKENKNVNTRLKELEKGLKWRQRERRLNWKTRKKSTAKQEQREVKQEGGQDRNGEEVEKPENPFVPRKLQKPQDFEDNMRNKIT